LASRQQADDAASAIGDHDAFIRVGPHHADFLYGRIQLAGDRFGAEQQRKLGIDANLIPRNICLVVGRSLSQGEALRRCGAMISFGDCGGRLGGP